MVPEDRCRANIHSTGIISAQQTGLPDHLFIPLRNGRQVSVPDGELPSLESVEVQDGAKRRASGVRF